MTEEDILGRCRTAIEDGLSLVTRSYECHEIQDSDSDDDDTSGRLVKTCNALSGSANLCTPSPAFTVILSYDCNQVQKVLAIR